MNSKSSQRPISYMSVDTGEPQPSPYSNFDNYDTEKHIPKQNKVKREGILVQFFISWNPRYSVPKYSILRSKGPLTK